MHMPATWFHEKGEQSCAITRILVQAGFSVAVERLNRYAIVFLKSVLFLDNNAGLPFLV